MMLYGVRFLLNLFEMLIYRRFLEAYIGNRRTGLELSVLIMGICAGISRFVNSLGNPVCNLLYTVMILWLFSLQYRAAGRSRIFAVLIYVGINFVTEPIGYVLHMAVVGVWGRKRQERSCLFLCFRARWQDCSAASRLQALSAVFC